MTRSRARARRHRRQVARFIARKPGRFRVAIVEGSAGVDDDVVGLLDGDLTFDVHEVRESAEREIHEATVRRDKHLWLGRAHAAAQQLGRVRLARLVLAALEGQSSACQMCGHRFRRLSDDTTVYVSIDGARFDRPPPGHVHWSPTNCGCHGPGHNMRGKLPTDPRVRARRSRLRRPRVLHHEPWMRPEQARIRLTQTVDESRWARLHRLREALEVVDLRDFGVEHVEGSYVIEDLAVRRSQHGGEILADITFVRFQMIPVRRVDEDSIMSAEEADAIIASPDSTPEQIAEAIDDRLTVAMLDHMNNPGRPPTREDADETAARFIGGALREVAPSLHMAMENIRHAGRIAGAVGSHAAFEEGLAQVGARLFGIDTVEPHTLNIIVEGGDDADVARAISERLGAAQATSGSVSIDVDGHVVQFSRPDEDPEERRRMAATLDPGFRLDATDGA